MTQTTRTLRTAIQQANTLVELQQALVAMEGAFQAQKDRGLVPWSVTSAEDWCRVDLGSLPTFGSEPTDIGHGVWSWDADRVLVCSGNTPAWQIVPRVAVEGK